MSRSYIQYIYLLIFSLLLVECFDNGVKNSLVISEKVGKSKLLIKEVKGEKLLKLAIEDLNNIKIRESLQKIKEAKLIGANLDEIITINGVSKPFILHYSDKILNFFSIETRSLKPAYKQHAITPLKKECVKQLVIDLLEATNGSCCDSLFFALTMRNDITKEHKINILKFMLPYNFNVNKKIKIGKYSYMPLCLSILYNDLVAFKWLVEHNADVQFVDEHTGSYLYLATMLGNFNLAKHLKRINAKISLPTKEIDAIFKFVHILPPSIERKQIVEEINYIFDFLIVDEFLQQNSLFFEMLKTEKITTNDPESILKLVKISSKNETKYRTAFAYESPEQLYEIISQKKFRLQLIILDALLFKYPTLFNFDFKYLNHLGDLEKKNIFTFAIKNENYSFIIIFLKNVDVNAADRYGVTLLDIAIKYEDVMSVILLITIADANPYLKDAAGNSSFKYANALTKSANKDKILEILQQSKFKPFD